MKAASMESHSMNLLSPVSEMKIRMQILGSSTLSTFSVERSPHRERIIAVLPRGLMILCTKLFQCASPYRHLALDGTYRSALSDHVPTWDEDKEEMLIHNRFACLVPMRGSDETGCVFISRW